MDSIMCLYRYELYFREPSGKWQRVREQVDPRQDSRGEGVPLDFMSLKEMSEVARNIRRKREVPKGSVFGYAYSKIRVPQEQINDKATFHAIKDKKGKYVPYDKEKHGTEIKTLNLR